MKWTDKKRKIFYFSLSGALIVSLLTLTIFYSNKAKKYEYELRANQQNAVVQLSEYIDKINTDLKKELYSSGTEIKLHSGSSLTKNSACAKSVLSQISCPDAFLQNTYKFLAQVSDYTETINNKAILGEEITDKEYESLEKLISYSNKLVSEIEKLYDNYEAGTNFKVQSNSINTDLSDIEQSMSDYPSLIYDGPFSDHMNMENADMLNSEKEISKEEALKKAAFYIGLEEKDLTFSGVESGSFDCYVFDTISTSISITKKGGYLCSILSSNRSGEVLLKESDAVKIAEKYLKKVGYDNMTSTYYTKDDGALTINFALKENDLTCYTDLIKVTVSLDNGRILGLDARTYLMNHKNRSFSEPKVSAEDAQKSVSKNLQIKSHKLALIPTNFDTEYLCYEFLCTSKSGDDILVYVDANTGQEKQILLLLYADGGTLTK